MSEVFVVMVRFDGLPDGHDDAPIAVFASEQSAMSYVRLKRQFEGYNALDFRIFTVDFLESLSVLED